MEPHDLKSNPPPDDAHFEAWLRTHAARPPLPDDGFSQRVLTALPAPRRRAGLPPRVLAIAIGTLAGVGLAAGKFVTGATGDWSLPPIGPEFTDALAQLADPKLHAALGVTFVTLAYVFWRNVRRQIGL